MKYSFLILVIFFSLNSKADCLPELSLVDFKSLVNKVQDEYFPELTNLNIGIKEFKSDAYFLQAQFTPGSVTKKKEKRKYFIEYNPKILACPPSIVALEAILIHEFEHIVDYTNMTGVQIINFALKYGSNKKWRSKYERETDLKVLIRGKAEGLKAYRKWLYPQLNSKQLKLKRLYYYTPEEIDQWSDNQK